MAARLVDELAAVTRLWAQLRVVDRARYLERGAQAVIDQFDEHARAIAAESRRPLGEVAALELLGAVDALRWMAEHAQRLLGAHRFPLSRALHPLTRASAGHAPVGVVGLRAGDGSPFAHPLTAVAAALLAGNGVIVAPAASAPQSALAVASVLARAGLPEGLVRLSEDADALVGADKLLDLGAEPRVPDAMIVLADANLGHAVDGALWAACAGAGTLQRVYVTGEQVEEFVAALCLEAESLQLGDPLAPGTQLGPLVGTGVAATLEAAIAEAVAFGAVRHCGGAREPAGAGGGAFVAPSVLSGVPEMARLMRERVSGPVLAVVAVADSEEAARLANGVQPSVGASIWSADRRRAVRVARELTARVVWGNDHAPGLPLRQAAADALEQCRRAQLITWEPAARRAPWRYPYDATATSAARSLAALHSTRDGEREQALREGGPAILRVASRSLRR